MGRVFANEVLKACESLGVESRFEMILLAAHRAKIIPKISQSKYVLPAEEYDNVSSAVSALRELESSKLDIQELRDSYIQSFCQIEQKDLDKEISEQES